MNPKIATAACLVALVAIASFAQTVKPISFPEVTGDAAAHQFASSGSCRTVQIIAPSGNGAVLRIGDSTASATKGLPVAAGAGLFLPPLTLDSRNSTDQRYYDLASLYYYAATGDKVDFVCFR